MIKKDKIFELKIEDDDEISGIDSISLVDEPAIEVNWVAFKKEKEHEFHIPDNEDDIYLDKLFSVGQDEQELLDEGWVPFKTISVKESFATTPNDDSEEDTDILRVRYKYSLNQGIQGPNLIPTTRKFCRDLINKNYVWRAEEIQNLQNDFGDSAQIWRGGYNCRHEWYKTFYQKSGSIINKSSVNKGKIAPGGFPVELSPDWLQPNTITSKTMNNPSPSTIRNLGLSKEKFADKPKVSIDYDGTLSTPEGEDLYKELVAQGNEVYIVTKRNELEGQPVLDKAKALRIPQSNVIFTNGKDKSPILKQLGITKHYDNSPDVVKEITKNAPGIEAIQFEYNVGSIGGYVDPGFNPKKKKKQMSEEFEYLHPKQDMSKQHFATDDEKHIVLGPAMIPDQKIFRKDKSGNPYYVFFSPETIKMIAEKYMRNKYTDNNDLMHDGKAVNDIHVLESWIKEDESDKSSKYGFSDLPVGTWFVSMKVNNPDVWKQIKEGKLNGFSVSGFFEEVQAFSKEEMFLYQVADLLKNIKE